MQLTLHRRDEVAELANHLLLSRGSFVPRNKDLLESLARVDPELSRLARAFLLASQPGERINLGAMIADQALGTRGFFEWESEPEPGESA